MNIIIFGPQGSGKGTQAEIISIKYNIPHISTGDIFRDHMKKKTDLGKQIKSLMNGGNLVPDDVTNRIIKDRLSLGDCHNGFMLDGYPRNISQAKFLDNITNIDFAIDIMLNDDEAIKRISNRRICKKCEAVYHLISNPPARENLCDTCDSKLAIRQDDQPEAIKKRLSIYHIQTEPLIKYYQDKGIYKQIDGHPSIEEVTMAILNILKL